MNRVNRWMSSLFVVALLATPAIAQAHGHAAHVARQRDVHRGGGPGPSLRHPSTGLKHERVAHNRASTGGFHFHSAPRR